MPKNLFTTGQITTCLIALVCSLLVGCQHRAQTDMYVDSMAGEIRDLEDQLYHYDHEYRLLEQELESLRRRNAAVIQPSTQPAQPEKSPFDFLPRDPSQSDKTTPRKAEEVPLPDASSNGTSGAGSDAGGSKQPPRSILNDPAAPMQMQRPSNDNLPPPKNAFPSFPSNNSTTPSTDSSNPTKPSGSGDMEFNPGDLIVPTITTGSLTPPSIDPKQISVSPDRDLELSLSQIEIPTQLAAGHSNSARISSAVQVVTDKRIVELSFNPALTRAVSFDDDNRDDGLYIVLQPKNEQGQVVALPAAVSIEVLDPTRPDDKTIIGQWNYSAREVEGKIQPIGSKQGIHLTLPWNGPNPKSDRVTVVATYQFENGRKLIARKEIYLNSGAGLKTVWTPRAAQGQTAKAQETATVINASANIPVSEGHDHSVQSVGTYAAPETAPAPAVAAGANSNSGY